MIVEALIWGPVAIPLVGFWWLFCVYIPRQKQPAPDLMEGARAMAANRREYQRIDREAMAAWEDAFDPGRQAFLADMERERHRLPDVRTGRYCLDPAQYARVTQLMTIDDLYRAMPPMAREAQYRIRTNPRQRPPSPFAMDPMAAPMPSAKGSKTSDPMYRNNPFANDAYRR